jgi:hypothetical protein
MARATSAINSFYRTLRTQSCRDPLVKEIEADFKGKDAKLKWPVSLDGKKFDSETYKILAVIDEPNNP